MMSRCRTLASLWPNGSKARAYQANAAGASTPAARIARLKLCVTENGHPYRQKFNLAVLEWQQRAGAGMISSARLGGVHEEIRSCYAAAALIGTPRRQGTAAFYRHPAVGTITPRFTDNILRAGLNYQLR